MNHGLPATQREALIDPVATGKLYLLDQSGIYRWLANLGTSRPLERVQPL